MVRQGTQETDSAPGAPQERTAPPTTHVSLEEVKELRRRYPPPMPFLTLGSGVSVPVRLNL